MANVFLRDQLSAKTSPIPAKQEPIDKLADRALVPCLKLLNSYTLNDSSSGGIAPPSYTPYDTVPDAREVLEVEEDLLTALRLILVSYIPHISKLNQSSPKEHTCTEYAKIFIDDSRLSEMDDLQPYPGEGAYTLIRSVLDASASGDHKVVAVKVFRDTEKEGSRLSRARSATVSNDTRTASLIEPTG
jgi:hypothetical protein